MKENTQILTGFYNPEMQEQQFLTCHLKLGGYLINQHTQGAMEQDHMQCSEVPLRQKNTHLPAFKQLLMTQITESSVRRKTYKPSATAQQNPVCRLCGQHFFLFLDPFPAKDGLLNITPTFKSPMGWL